MEAYRGWVVRNRPWLASIESIANTMTWFMPERFSSSELAPEAVSALVGLLTITNEHIVKTSSIIPPSGGYSQHRQTSRSTSGRQNSFSWAFCISIMKELEVFIEMAAEHYGGKDTKWNAVAAVEGVKVFIRLMVFHKSGYKILLDGGESENTGEAAESYEPSGAPHPPTRLNPMREYLGAASGGYLNASSRRNGVQPMGGQFSQSMEGRAMQAMSNFSKNMTRNSKPSWTRSNEVACVPAEEGATLKKESRITSAGFLGKLFVTGEVLLIARPLLYVLLIKRFGLRSWKPWLSSLAIDVSGTTLLYTVDHILRQRYAKIADKRESVYVPFSDMERKELRRRHLAWAFYVMRDPFFVAYTRRPFEKMESNLQPAPLIGALASKVVELILGVQAFYMYTAAS